MNNFERSKNVIPGGVNSPVRAWGSVGRDPYFISSGKGKYLYTYEGTQLLDFCMSWGALPLGHSPEVVVEGVQKQLSNGTSFGTPTMLEVELAELICESTPSVEMVRMVSSGTEAVMSALRVARGFTGRNLLLKFDGCYHGHSDSLLVNAGSGVAEIAGSSSLGVPGEFISNTISIPYGDIEIFNEVCRKYKNDIAAVIVEPIPANMGVIIPEIEFLKTLRQVTEEIGALLIFDEVITGFRTCYGGYQNRCGIRADMTILGKIIGGGFPAAAFGGSKEIMSVLSPVGGVYQAGTLSGNPIAVTAGIATLEYLKDNKNVYTQMEAIVERFAEKYEEVHGTTVNRIGSMFTIFHTDNMVHNFSDAKLQDEVLFKKRFNGWIEKNIYTPPSMYEAFFISTLHTEEDLESLI